MEGCLLKDSVTQLIQSLPVVEPSGGIISSNATMFAQLVLCTRGAAHHVLAWPNRQHISITFPVMGSPR